MTYSILAIDDDPKILKILQHTLSKEGLKVSTASCGEEALLIDLVCNLYGFAEE